MLFEPKEFTNHESFVLGFTHLRGHVGEVDTPQRFLDMERPRFAVDARAIPVEDPIGGVGVLLDLVDEKSGPDGVEATTGNEEVLPFFDGERMNAIFRLAPRESLPEAKFVDSLTHPYVEFRAGFGISDIPDLRLRLAPQFRRDGRRRVDLQGKGVACIENLAKERKSILRRGLLPEYAAAQIRVGPEFGEGSPVKRAPHDTAIGLPASRDLPRLPVGLHGVRQSAPKAFRKTPPPPNSGLINGFESNKGVRQREHDGRGGTKRYRGAAVFAIPLFQESTPS